MHITTVSLYKLMLRSGFCFFFPAIFAVSLANGMAQGIPKLINYQGRLTKADGKTPIDDGNYGVQFRLWNKPLSSAPGSQLVWGAEYQVTVLDGQFNVILGALGGAQLAGAGVNDLSFAFGEGERYLGLTISKDKNGAALANAQEIQPRQQLLSVPYAIQAAYATQAGGVADGVITLPKLAPPSLAISPAIESWKNLTMTFQPVTGSGGQTLSVTLASTGRPIEVFLMSSGTNTTVGADAGTILAKNDNGDNAEAGMVVALLRNGIPIATQYLAGNRAWRVNHPPGAIRFIDTAGPSRLQYIFCPSAGRWLGWKRSAHLSGQARRP